MVDRSQHRRSRAVAGHHQTQGQSPRIGPFVPAFATDDQRALSRELSDAGYCLGRVDLEERGIGWCISQVTPYLVAVEALDFEDVLSWWRARIEPKEWQW